MAHLFCTVYSGVAGSAFFALQRSQETITLNPDRLNMLPGTCLRDIWQRTKLGTPGENPLLPLPPGGCVFIAYEGAAFPDRAVTTEAGN